MLYMYKYLLSYQIIYKKQCKKSGQVNFGSAQGDFGAHLPDGQVSQKVNVMACMCMFLFLVTQVVVLMALVYLPDL